MKSLLIVSTCVVCILQPVDLLNNGLALTPPMGWLSWQRYRCHVECDIYGNDCLNEQLIMRTADAMATDGWLQHGYNYLIIDDCWMSKERDPNTQQLMPDPKRFPKGIRWLADYVHSKGLKFGIYLDFGTLTCGGYPGSLFFLKLDAITISNWGVDYVKLDGCYSDVSVQPEGYEVFAKFLNATSRPIVFSCSYPAYVLYDERHINFDWVRLQKNCNLWRLSEDIQDSWYSVSQIIEFYQKNSELLSTNAGPGHWNDPDMLIVGNYGLSYDETKVQMGMWAMFAAPLLLSLDLNAVKEEDTKLLQNTMLININQDSGGHQAKYIDQMQYVKVWTRPLNDLKNGWAISFLNPSAEDGGPISCSFSLKDIHIPKSAQDPNIIYQLVDVFTRSVYASVNVTEKFKFKVNPSGIFMLLAHS